MHDLASFASARLLVVGDVILDRYWHGPTKRVSPEAPVPVVLVEQTEERPGGAGNVAVNVRALGAQVTLVGVTGMDEAAAKLLRILELQGVACRFVEVAGFPTVTKLRVLSQHQQLIRLDFEQVSHALDLAPLMTAFETCLDECDAVLLSDYAKGALVQIEQMIAKANAVGKPIIVDPKGEGFERYRGATVMTPNLMEFEAVVGTCSDQTQLADKGRALLKELSMQALLITRGEAGMTLIEAGGAVHHLSAQAAEVYDVTGAGDTVVATLGLALAVGEPLLMAATLANVAAGRAVAKLGAATVSAEELRSALMATPLQGLGIVDEDSLVVAVQEARRRGQRIVMTNGCFDILHAGHVSYLEAARRLGDRLVVAMNDDASVRRLKGPGRPVNPLGQRMTVLNGLAAVDWVTPFSEQTPERLIQRVGPDVLVKGGDYRPEQIAGAKQVKERGGEVIVLDYIPGLSTSKMIDVLSGASTTEETDT